MATDGSAERAADEQTGATRTRPPGRASLRSRLILLTALGLALLIAERTSSILTEHKDKLEAVKTHVLNLTDRGMAQYRETLASVHSVLQVMTLDAGALAARPEHCERLNRIVEMTDSIASLSVIGPDGIVLCSSNSQARGLDVSDRDYFRIARNGVPNLSSVVHSYYTNTPSVFAAQPAIDDDGNVIAILIARIELELLFPITVISDLDLSAVVLMIDPTGIVITAYPDAPEWIGKNLSNTSLVSHMMGRSEGTIDTEGPDGVRRIYGFQRLPESNMRLAVGLDAQQLMAPVENATWRAASTFLAACALIFIGLWLAGERLVVRPVQSLAARFASFGRGENDPAAEGETRIVELEPLIAAFSAMARQLTQREEALQEANRQLKTLASLDPLTGVPNRRAFDQMLQSRWQDGTERIAMLMIDIDHFKEFNDIYGHGEGDACLRRVAAALAASVRGVDLVARLGGEEFAVLLPGADANAAADVANRLRVTVENLDVRHASAMGGRVTVSIGYAACRPVDGSQPGDLHSAADAALYAAKRAGRNAARHGNVLSGTHRPSAAAG